jgi:hypothetical protein
MMLDPPLGSKLVGGLRELAKARNPGAHGGAVNVTAEDVARWMVDAATVYEWSLRAQPP